jgi:hypothetical protein
LLVAEPPAPDAADDVVDEVAVDEAVAVSVVAVPALPLVVLASVFAS